MDRVRNERDRMLQENNDIGRDKSDADAEKLRFKAGLLLFTCLFNNEIIEVISKRANYYLSFGFADGAERS